MLLSSQSDERLVSLARAGHERAFATIVERYRPELHALARRLCPDGRAEDVLQQALLSAFVALRSGAEVKHLRGWLYQIVRNAACRAPAPLHVPLDGATPSAETLEDVVQLRALARSTLAELARLPERQRRAMVDTALAGMGRAEVASEMGLSEGAVRQLVHRARRSLRSVATALTPWPLARWFAAGGSAAPGPGELAAGAGAVTTGTVAAKLGALLASGTLLTGVAAVGLHGGHPRRAATHRAAVVRASVRRGAAGSAVVNLVASRTLAVPASRLEVTSLVRAIRGEARPVSTQRTIYAGGGTRAGRRDAGRGRSEASSRGDGSSSHPDHGGSASGGGQGADGGSRGDGGGSTTAVSASAGRDGHDGQTYPGDTGSGGGSGTDSSAPTTGTDSATASSDSATASSATATASSDTATASSATATASSDTATASSGDASRPPGD